MPFLVNKVLDISAALGLYDWWANRSLRDVHDTLVGLADPRGGEEVLEVGCGTGLLSSRLARLLDGGLVHGIDIGPNMVTIARRRARIQHLNAEYTVGTAVRLPYPDGQFDVVFSCLVFHLLDDPEKELVFREIYRVLKPGGKYVCAEFKEYPAGFFCRRLLAYPKDLIGVVGFDVDTQLPGRSITKCRSIVYRNLVRPGG